MLEISSSLCLQGSRDLRNHLNMDESGYFFVVGSGPSMNESTTFNCIDTNYNAFLMYCDGMSHSNYYEGTMKFVGSSTTKYYAGAEPGCEEYKPVDILTCVGGSQFWEWQSGVDSSCWVTNCNDLNAVSTGTVPFPSCP